jgi:hypothetical protein
MRYSIFSKNFLRILLEHKTAKLKNICPKFSEEIPQVIQYHVHIII